LIGSIPTSRPEVVARLLNSRWAFELPEHPFTITSYPPVTVLGRHLSLSLVVPAIPKSYRPPRERHLSPISAIDLLSTSTRQILQFPSSPALTVPTTASGPAPLTRTLVRALEQHRHRRRQIAASGISDPKWCRGWRREHQLQPWSNAPRLGVASVALTGRTSPAPNLSAETQATWPGH
jgi:hypothetical protein